MMKGVLQRSQIHQCSLEASQEQLLTLECPVILDPSSLPETKSSLDEQLEQLVVPPGNLPRWDFLHLIQFVYN